MILLCFAAVVGVANYWILRYFHFCRGGEGVVGLTDYQRFSDATFIHTPSGSRTLKISCTLLLRGNSTYTFNLRINQQINLQTPITSTYQVNAKYRSVLLTEIQARHLQQSITYSQSNCKVSNNLNT